MGLARLSVMRKQFADAEQRYARILENHAKSTVIPEAMYWKDVSRYSQSHDASALQSVARELKERFPDSQWAVKASVWGGG